MKNSSKNKLKPIGVLKNILLILILLSGQLCMAQSAYAEYDFNVTDRDQFQELPFDKSFSVKLLHIPNDVDRVKVQFLKRNQNETTAELSAQQWQRSSAGETSGLIPFHIN
jgi:hypothetical protein